MERTLAASIGERIGEKVRLTGWVHHQRHLARVAFLLLRDRTGIVQIVITADADRDLAATLVPESVVEIHGSVVANASAPAGVEVVDPTLVLISEALVAPPFELRRSDIPAQLPTLLDNAAVSLRHPRRRAIAALAAASAEGFRRTLCDLDFTEIFTPKVVASATEGGANVFPIDWFGRRAFLAQSPQFYKQTMVGVFERVFEVAPVFRAEPHDTVRHLAEYVSLDVELGFIRDHRDIMALARDVLAGMLAAVKERRSATIDVLGIELPALADEIPSVDFEEAQRMIERDTGRPTVGEPDLSPADERWLGAWALERHHSDFLFVTGYPMSKRPFYTMPDPNRLAMSNSFDLLFRGLELMTGGQRLHRYDEYIAALGDVDLAPFEAYLQAFRHGMPPHGGFAIGLERWTARLTGAANIREATLFPRDINRLTP